MWNRGTNNRSSGTELCARFSCWAVAAAAVVVAGAQTHFMSPGQRVGSARGKAKAAFLVAVAEFRQPGRGGGSLGRQSTGAQRSRENAKCRGGRQSCGHVGTGKTTSQQTESLAVGGAGSAFLEVNLEHSKCWENDRGGGRNLRYRSLARELF